MTGGPRREQFTLDDGTTFNVTVTYEPKKASALSSDDVFADGALILRLSFQRDWVYASTVKLGKPIRRRFRYDQIVLVEQRIYTRA